MFTFGQKPRGGDLVFNVKINTLNFFLKSLPINLNINSFKCNNG